MRAAGIKFVQKKPVEVHPVKEGRRVPLSMLRKRLRVEEYERETPFADVRFEPRSVRLKLSQHAGPPATPMVRPGDQVKQGDLVAVADKTGIHASIAGKVRAVSETYVEVEAYGA